LKIKLKGRHFDTIEVLNTVTEQNVQDVFKKWQMRWERCIRAEGDSYRGAGGQ
jgi:hypothetical protein